MMMTMEIYLYRERERISAVSRERKKEISLLFRSTKEALRELKCEYDVRT